MFYVHFSFFNIYCIITDITHCWPKACLLCFAGSGLDLLASAKSLISTYRAARWWVHVCDPQQKAVQVRRFFWLWGCTMCFYCSMKGPYSNSASTVELGTLLVCLSWCHSSGWLVISTVFRPIHCHYDKRMTSSCHLQLKWDFLASVCW